MFGNLLGCIGAPYKCQHYKPFMQTNYQKMVSPRDNHVIGEGFYWLWKALIVQLEIMSVPSTA